MYWLTERWYRPSKLIWLLWPLSQLYRALIGLRRWTYRSGLRRSIRLPVPVIIVGNISVGGTGKTPLVIWLAQQLRQAGFRPGIVSRGYGGRGPFPLAVNSQSQAEHCGDEPLLIQRRSGCPLVVDPDRPRAARSLLANYNCDVIIADDGLQHYRLARDIEIVVVDSQRQFGNGLCLPAGPLREPVSRLQSADFIISHGQPQLAGTFSLQLQPGQLINLQTSAEQPLSAFAGQAVHAVAGIGNPQRFFKLLQQHGLQPIAHRFADHHGYQPADLQFEPALPILMTEKDAVKCQAFANDTMWYLPVDAELSPELIDRICKQLRKLDHG